MKKITRVLGLLGGGMLACVMGPAWAQDTLLGSYGQTRLQEETGDAVQITCGGFVADIPNGGPTPDESALFFTCRSMVATALDLEGSDDDRVQFSLGLSEDELAASLQQIATEEFAATESYATEMTSSRMDPVITRLAELRAGVKGFSVAGLFPEVDTKSVARLGHGALGGAAGDDGMGSRLGGFINVGVGTGDRDGTDRTDSFDFDSYNLVAGLDYRFSDSLVLGAAVNYYDIDSDFDKSSTVSGGNIDVDGWGVTVFGTWYGERSYVDLVAGYAASEYDVRRSILIPSNNPQFADISETATASPDSDDYTVSIGAGYDFNRGALNWGPYFRATYLNVDIDDYTEKGAELSGLNLKVDGQEWESTTTVLGLKFDYAMSRDWGVLIPYGRVGWTHQFEDDATIMTAVYVDDPRENVLRASTEDPEEDYAELGVGVSAVFTGGLQAYFNYDTLLGIDDLTTHLFTVGLRKEF